MFCFPIALGGWIGIFKPSVQNIQMFMSWKLLHGFQPNFQLQERAPNMRHGRSSNVKNKSNGHRLEKLEKLQYLCNRLTNFD